LLGVLNLDNTSRVTDSGQGFVCDLHCGGILVLQVKAIKQLTPFELTIENGHFQFKISTGTVLGWFHFRCSYLNCIPARRDRVEGLIGIDRIGVEI
jgi:hypothetical protein